MKYPTGFALALISVVGCGGGATAPATKAPVEPAAPAAVVSPEVEVIDLEARGAAVHAEVPRVVLLEAGDGEREALRWELRPWTYTLDVRLGHRTSATGDKVMIDEGHAVEARVELELHPDGNDRTAMVGIRVVEARLAEVTGSHEHVWDDIAATHDKMLGVRVTSRGQELGFATLTGDDRPSMAMVALATKVAEALLVPLPEEPVGIGARWRTRKAIPMASVAAIEETVYTLTVREGDLLTVTATVHRLPLFDAQGMIPVDQLDSPRARDAVAALGTQTLGELDRNVDPSARGERLAMFGPKAPLFGKFLQHVTLTASGEVKAESGTYALEVQIADDVELTSPELLEDDEPTE